MNLICKLAFLIIPINIIAIAIVQLQHLHRASNTLIQENFGNNTLLVIAHPDDETMFFGPLILNLLDANKNLHILCLSNGNSDSLGKQRSNELSNVVRELGQGATLNIVDDNRLLDGLDRDWDAQLIRDHIDSYVLNAKGSKYSSIETIVTFDSHGVTGHKNHRSIFEAVINLGPYYKDLGIKFRFLVSVNLVRKYLSFLDVLVTCIPKLLIFDNSSSANHDIILGLDFSGNQKLRHLLAIHKSQMVWFRRLYMIFSRYMFINDLNQPA